MSSVSRDLIPIGGGTIVKLIGLGIAVFAGIFLLKKGSQALGNFSLFGEANAEEQKAKGGQTNDVQAERARADAELSRLESELARVEEEASRAESEGRRGDAEFLRAQAELLRAEAEKARSDNDRLAITLSDSKGTLNTNVTIGEDGEKPDIKKDVAQSSTIEANQNTSNETPSGQTETVDAPSTVVADSKEQSISVDVNQEAIEKIANRTRRTGRQSVFLKGQ